MKKKGIAAAIAASAALLAGGIASASASASSTPEPPPRPPWVNADGTVDNSKMPDTLPVVGPDGKLLKDAKGAPLRTDARPFEPGKAPSDKRIGPGEKRWIEKGENGETIEHVEIEPTPPPAN